MISSTSEESDKDLQWWHKLPSGNADVCQFVGEQCLLNKICYLYNSQPLNFFVLYFETIVPVFFNGCQAF
jgi:hypothetical protein